MELSKRFSIEGLVEIQPNIFKDDRGQFIETYNQETLKNLGIKIL